MSGNQNISSDELRRIRALDDFDLRMLLSEIHYHGWLVAKRTLDFIEAAAACDSGSDPKGENPRSGVEGEASQSGAAKTAHRPKPSIGNTPTRNTA